MSNQALTWAFGQQGLPCKAKFVLVSIANHADHTNGYCWLKASTISDEASIPERSLYRYLGALVRNGYLRREKRKGADGKQRANDYWILFNRPDAPWSWAAGVEDDDTETETQDDVEPGAILAVGEDEISRAPEVEETTELAVGPTAISGSGKDIAEPPKSNPEKSARENGFAAPPRGYRPPPAEEQGATHTATNERIFVYRGSRAWDAWMKYRAEVERKTSCNTYRQHVKGVGHREGWDFPSLFPPRRETERESGEEASGADPPSQKPA